MKLFQEYYAQKGVFENDVYMGIPEALAALKEAGIRLYVATAKPELFAVKILDRLALSPFFTDVIGADMEEKLTQLFISVQKGDKEINQYINRTRFLKNYLQIKEPMI